MKIEQNLIVIPTRIVADKADHHDVISLDIQVLSGYKFTIEILKITPLDKIHLIIQNQVNFGNDHLFHFFITKAPSYRNRSIIGKTEFYEPEEYEASISKISIGSLFPLPKRAKLFYLFDFGDCWYFEIKQSRAKIKTFYEKNYYPRVTKSSGEIPEQYPNEEY